MFSSAQTVFFVILGEGGYSLYDKEKKKENYVGM